MCSLIPGGDSIMLDGAECRGTLEELQPVALECCDAGKTLSFILFISFFLLSHKYE